MPTENRSSNTENLPCPFCAGRVDPGGWLRGDGTRGPECESCGATAPTLSVWNSANPTTQPHPDPIAWMVGTAFWWTKEEAERDAEETGLPIVPVGPMAGVAAAEQRSGDPVAWMAMTLKGSLAGTLGLARYDQRLNPDLYEGPFPVFRHADPAEVERLREEVEKQRRLKMHVAENLQNALDNCSVYRAHLAEQSTLLQLGLEMINRGIVSFDDQIEYRQKLAALAG